MAETVQRITAGRTRGELDEIIQLPLARSIEILGEAAARVSAETREQAPEIPWAQMIGTRNRLVHAYFDVDVDILWRTATESVPALLPALRALHERF